MKINHLKLFAIIAVFGSYQQISFAQATSNSNTLSATSPATLPTSPTQYIGSSNVADVIFRSGFGSPTPTAVERFRINSATGHLQLAATTNILGAANGARLQGAAGNTAANPAYGFNVSGETGLGMFRSSANQLSFSTNGIERMRILSTGSVGIGNSAPTATLDVTGTGKFSSNLTSPLYLFNPNNGFSWTQGANANVGTFLYGKVVTPTLPSTSELTSAVKHKFAGGIKLFETDVNGNFPTTGSQLNIQHASSGYIIDVLGTNKILQINPSYLARTQINNSTTILMQYALNQSALAVINDDIEGASTNFNIFGDGRTKIGSTPIDFPPTTNITNATFVSTSYGSNVNTVYNGVFSTQNDLNKGLAVFKRDASGYSENFSVQGNGNITSNGNLYLGAASTETAKINVFNTNKSGLISKTEQDADWGNNSTFIVNRSNTGAIVVNNTETNPTGDISLILWGNGRISSYMPDNSAIESFVINKKNASNVQEKQFTVYADGRTSIGELNGFVPNGYKLAVKGKVVAEEVLVANRALWPDYVFNNNYKLKSIEELDTYIKTNKHLPNIPSASEMQAGIEAGTMITKQMEKIEELTLYIIEQNKIAKAQNQKLEEQEKRLKVLEEKLK